MRTGAYIIAWSLLAGTACAPVHGTIPAAADPLGHALEVFADIDARNRTVERSSGWLDEAYRSLAIKDLRAIPRDSYERYRPFAKSGRVYIVVHPGYFPFFDEWSVTPIHTDYARGLPRENIADRVAGRLRATDVAYQVARQQERATKDFIEFLSHEKQLVILVLPRDYRQHLTYGYVPGYDEYARYLNEMTNGAENIVYVESDSHHNGYLRDEDLLRLSAFLDAAGARTVLLGGGFLGKCLDNFAASLRKRYSHDSIWHVPELTTVSPADIIADRASFLSFWGGLREQRIRKYLSSVPVNRTTREPFRWADLMLAPVERYR